MDIDKDTATNYIWVETMDPLVEEYRELYPKDLTQHISLDKMYLQTALTNHVLLNPMFGLQSRIVGPGLLLEVQYRRARLSQCGDIFRTIYVMLKHVLCFSSLQLLCLFSIQDLIYRIEEILDTKFLPSY